MPFNQTFFKKTDVIIQSAAMAIIGAIWFFDTDLAMMSFFVGIGGWQLLSMCVHLFNKWNLTFFGRRLYHYMLLGLIIVFLISLVNATVMIWVLYLALFITPLLAFYYLVICYIELLAKK